MEDRNYKKLELMALKIRRDVVSMLYHRGYGHIGGSLSLVEAYTLLYGKHAHVRPQDPLWKDRDRIVLSKGHAGPVMYSTLAEGGFFRLTPIASKLLVWTQPPARLVRALPRP